MAKPSKPISFSSVKLEVIFNFPIYNDDTKTDQELTKSINLIEKLVKKISANYVVEVRDIQDSI